MIGICRALKIALMTRETICRCAGELIVHVALRTHHREMRAGEWKARAVVVEVSRSPRIIVVANLAILREIAGHVIRVRSLLKIRLMAGEAIRRRAGKAIVCVALVAGGRGVSAEQWKSRAAVIETAEIARAGNLPSGNRAAVAYFAAQRKTGELMIRIGRGLVILAMANPALQRHVDESALALRSVAIVAADVLMPTQQRETG